MNRFYGENITNISNEILLEANPFHKDPRINFLGKLTPSIFFENFYVDSIDISQDSQDKDIINFTSEFNDAVNTSKGNLYAKVDLIHLSGYGGCGKTTFIRHLIWEKFKDYSLKYVIDFAGEQSIESVFTLSLSKLIYRNFYIEKTLKWEYFENLNFFETRKFGSVFPIISIFVKEITDIQIGKNIDELAINNVFIALKDNNFNNSEIDYIDFLMRFYFFVQLLESIICQNKPMVLLFDNVDSIDNIEEERNFVLALKEFIIDCNYFFGINSENENTINGQSISSIVEKFKMICFLTTRIVTIKKFMELAPDMEEMYGWKSLKMPDNYFNHIEIIDKKINYYLEDKIALNSIKKEDLRRLQDFSHTVYKTSLLGKLFNGNIRFTIKTMCNILKSYYSTDIPNECIEMFSNKYHHDYNDGFIGMIINLVLNYFKDNNIYSKKLHLSNCIPDNHISISRLILTILREKNGNCSIIEIFDCLEPFFDIKEICDSIYSLSEVKRDVWRRLIIFGRNFPKNGVDDLYNQKDLYIKGERSTDQYSTIELCSAGETYLEVIIPHFEFLLSRHSSYDYSTNSNYYPLFSKSSQDCIGGYNSLQRYRFERKIDWVYSDVRDCCKNSCYIASKIRSEYDWDENYFLNFTVYNYRSKYNDGTFGYKQSYISRLIFGHIGYIERYRRFILKKLSNSVEITELIDINKRLVSRIKKYLELYTNPISDEYFCYPSQRQDDAAVTLSKCIKEIEDSNYSLLDTLIEIVK